MARPIMERLRDLATKWTNRAVAAQPDYVREVSRPDTAQFWQAKAAAAAQTYNAAMEQVIRENRWGNVMQRTDPNVYLENVRAKADRRVQGIQVATNKWAANFAPIAEAIDRVVPTLPPRGPKMSDQNIQRFMAVISAIHQAAQARKGLSPVAAAATPIAASTHHSPPPIQSPTPEVEQSAPQIPQIGSYFRRY